MEKDTLDENQENEKKDVEKNVKEKKETIQNNKKTQKKTESSDKEVFLALEEELSEQIKSLKDQLQESEKKRLLSHADLENTRKRLIREKEDAIKFANTKLVEELIVPIDNLDRAISSADSTQDVKSLIEGVSMVKSQLLSTLKKYGLTVIESVGKEFDPSIHEACMVGEDENVEVETVLQEFDKGYKLHDRVLRPAKVKVIKPKV